MRLIYNRLFFYLIITSLLFTGCSSFTPGGVPTRSSVQDANQTAELPTETSTPTAQPETPPTRTQRYTNVLYQLQLDTPPGWALMKSDPRYEKFGSDEGYFQVLSLSSGGMSLDELAQAKADQPARLFGTAPVIRPIHTAGVEARLVLPSTDQPKVNAGDSQWGEAIVPIPRPRQVQNQLVDFLVLQVDLDHLEDIVASLVFEDSTEAAQSAAISDTPAAGICPLIKGEIVSLTVNPDMPDPRCVQVLPGQMLSITNKTGLPLKAKLGGYEFILPPGEVVLINVPLGSYLVPGVHQLDLEGLGSAPEIWVIEEPGSSSVGVSTPANELIPPFSGLSCGEITSFPVYSTDGALLAVPTKQGIIIYDAQSLAVVRSLPEAKDIQFLAFSPDSDLMAGGVGWNAWLWDLAGGSLVAELFGSASSPESTLADLDFSPDGNWLGGGFDDGSIFLWNSQDGKFVSSMLGTTFDFSPIDPRLVAVWRAGEEPYIYSYSFNAGTPTDIVPGEEALFSPEGFLATVRQGRVRLLDMNSGKTLQEFQGTSLAFDPNGNRLALFDRNRVRTYRVNDGAGLRVMEGEWQAVERLEFAPDGKSLLSLMNGCPQDAECFADQRFGVLWDLAEGKLIQTIPLVQPGAWVIYTSDGKALLKCSLPEGNPEKWEISSQSQSP